MKFRIREEQAVAGITALFESYGYKNFKSGCFEEYSLYRENEKVLVGKNVITFTDLTGRLMAIRPDVTLSLIRRTDIAVGATEKYFYNERVYRRAAGGRDFREILQTGAEVVGVIDSLCEAELAELICKSLQIISPSYAVDISHVGFTEGLLSEFGSDGEEVKNYLRRKDVHDFLKLAENKKFKIEAIDAFIAAVNSDGDAEKTLELARRNILNKSMENAVDELEKLVRRLTCAGFGDKISINFSMANDADYYSGLVFGGYIDGVPQCVLSGGRYDNLLHKFGKEGGAIGFAVYLGELERYFAASDCIVDRLIIYDDGSEDEALKCAEIAQRGGKSVRLCRSGQQSALRAVEITDLSSGG